MADDVVDPQPPLLLTRRLDPASLESASHPGPIPLRLALAAEERTRLRGLRYSVCGRALLLQLPRGEPLRPGEWLAPAEGAALVRVEAAPEALLLVRAADPLALLQAAYHLGNRHVALELREGELRLMEDPVLADLLAHRGLAVERRHEPFLPEGGAYAGAGPGHSHDHDHHDQDHHHGSPHR
ncbi:MAG: urease accessory protein UreE [Synechococcaceae cyanobacterium]